jgi:hypothetical protein
VAGQRSRPGDEQGWRWEFELVGGELGARRRGVGAKNGGG